MEEPKFCKNSPFSNGKFFCFRAVAAALMLTGGDELHKFTGRTRPDFTGISNPGSRQIYLTFPADSTFREEDVSSYFR